MPFVKVKSPSPFEDVTGVLGGVEFKNGLSVYNVSPTDAFRIAASVPLVDAETGEEVSIVSHAARSRDMSLTEAVVQQLVDAQGKDEDKSPQFEAQPEKVEITQANEPEKVVTPKANDLDWSFTEESIGAIADKGGIVELREFAGKYDVRGVSISGIIQGLLAKKEANAKKEV